MLTTSRIRWIFKGFHSFFSNNNRNYENKTKTQTKTRDKMEWLYSAIVAGDDVWGDTD